MLFFSYVPISDGLKKHILREGYGNIARKGEQVTLHCMGFLDITPPKMFWNTKELGQRPFSFIVGKKQVIKGKIIQFFALQVYSPSCIKQQYR